MVDQTVIPFDEQARAQRKQDMQELADLENRVRELAQSNTEKQHELATTRIFGPDGQVGTVGVDAVSLVMSKLNLLAAKVLEKRDLLEWELEFAEAVESSLDETLEKVHQAQLIVPQAPQQLVLGEG